MAAKKAKEAEKAHKANGTKAAPTSVAAEADPNQISLKQLSLAVDRTATGVLTSQPQSRDIKVDSFSLSFHGRELIRNATLEFNYGRRYGLIGSNGSGKSTFLQSLAAREVPIPEHIDIHLLKEEAEPSEKTALRYVVEHAEKELERLEQQVEHILGEEGGAENPVLESIYERIEAMDAATFEVRASKILFGLGFNAQTMQKMTKDMSGGWRMRVSLAHALFIRPTVLLLDEPTNHLDLEACVWLEEYLSHYDRILVLISHSQDFLNGVCTNIINLTPKRQLTYYGGNYDTFVKTKAELEVNQTKAYNKQQAEIEHMKKFIASAGTYANLVRQAKSRQKIIDKMEAEGLVEKVEPPMKFTFRFTNVGKLPPPVLSFDDVSFSYSGKTEDFLYQNLDIAVDMDSRVALVGPNGAGKSTLLKIMTGDLDATIGRVTRHSHLKIGKYSQHSNDQLDMEASPIDYMRRKFKDLPQDLDYWRQNIGRYGLTGSHQTSPIGHLSDGLKSRLVFAELALSCPHIILLDEPTNHLDIESIDSLAEAINHYDGGIVLVSHDFRLISQIAQEIWVCDKRTVTKWDSDGGIESYKKMLKKKMLK
ncbi:P-loop containing nucleoside triphosphate hydrolase protein [Dimargaris cristalligena]|uniref:P-loop containing nucleoside triphosphate hydrolase protein n=1 Tax=Dimargaris cristalligena TaxID=215637 RepID=A0A4P9ZYX6_9FUNG|nr:P-loop containing nucleoside triphosphate hydrolase protein [Dimargaris cristalligena]|eukprot:RKP38903.1 P-loop containing nucleoside triphosphate hydrolase protein [Dimargaris cristalligena]